MNIYLVPGMLAVSLAFVVAGLCRLSMARNYLPAEVFDRSSHKTETSRGGGLAIMVPFLVTVLGVLLLTGFSANSPEVTLVVLAGFALALGWLDDRYGLKPVQKFAGQVILAILLTLSVGGIGSLPLPFIGDLELGLFGFVLAAFWIISFINVFNFMDGINGMAGGAAFIATSVMTVMGALAGRPDVATISLLLAGSLVGFFLYNYPSGKIFMGDSGSHGLGFLLAGLALLGAKASSAVPINFIFLPVIFLPFIFDVTVTLFSRILRRQPIYQAHKEHIYQRLHQHGMSHGQVTAIYMALCLIAAMTAWVIGYAPAHLKWLGPFALVCFMAAGALIVMSRSNQVVSNVEESVSGQSGD